VECLISGWRMCDKHVTHGFLRSLATITEERGEEAAVEAVRQLGVLLQAGGLPKNPSPEALLDECLRGAEGSLGATSDASGWGFTCIRHIVPLTTPCSGLFLVPVPNWWRGCGSPKASLF
jgi:hypothetical protein